MYIVQTCIHSRKREKILLIIILILITLTLRKCKIILIVSLRKKIKDFFKKKKEKIRKKNNLWGNFNRGRWDKDICQLVWLKDLL